MAFSTDGCCKHGRWFAVNMENIAIVQIKFGDVRYSKQMAGYSEYHFVSVNYWVKS